MCPYEGGLMTSTLNVLQGLSFVDAFFPGGGFAHSFGLETAVAEGRVTNASDLSAYLVALMRDGAGRLDAVALAAAHRAAADGALDALIEADRELDAFKLVREVREGSCLMGRRYLERGAECFPGAPVADLDEAVRRGASPGHAAPALGAVLAACGWSRPDAVAAGLYQTAVGWVSAALRLLPMGQRDGQRVLHDLLPVIDEATRDACDTDLRAMAPWTPLHDIRAMRHERQAIRLFRS